MSSIDTTLQWTIIQDNYLCQYIVVGVGIVGDLYKIAITTKNILR